MYLFLVCLQTQFVQYSCCNPGPGERDMILMQHDVGVQWFDGSREKRQISFTVYGDTSADGYSAMAKTVGLPTGIATKMVLTGV